MLDDSCRTRITTEGRSMCGAPRGEIPFTLFWWRHSGWNRSFSEWKEELHARGFVLEIKGMVKLGASSHHFYRGS